MEEETKHEEMLFNLTTPKISPLLPNPGYIIAPCVILILIGCVVAVVAYMRTKSRLDELRHRLIPLYSYDPAEAEDWREEGRSDDEELTEPLYTEGKLSLSSDYGI
ncbi:hypothetical protein JOB18_021940 [Solea senegalensis]|uniref:Small integral membrane protein 29 n=1 Tax=Solea senegalensis TaxID=28829 RepID=A0AAV6SZ81_SOLSE|nr:uncharacterized protein C3orf18 homolog [Solea senegalensis]KAG7522427.1 hypothetical protein JOB18_021940 [Solea senegalensis]